MTDAMRWLLVVLMVSVAVVGVVLNVEAGNKVVVIPLFNDEAGATGDATMADVLEGRTFSNDSRMGLSGTMPNIDWQFITPGTTAKGIPAGYHNGTGEVAGDAELVPENIKNGVNIFGVAGTSVLASGTATPDQVLSGVTYSSVSGVSTGSMPNNGAVNITPGIIEQLIPSGYHGGMGLVAGDPDLVPDNIKKDVSIFGVTGTSVHASGTATDNMVLSGATYSNTLGASTGSMPDNGAVNITPSIIEQLIPAGYHDGMGLVAGDPELVEENIKSGVTLFDVVGAYPLAGVPKTGSEISNTPGEDGDLQMGVELPNPRFTSNLDGTVTDNLTGLIWLKNASCPEAWAIWPTAMSYVTQLNTNGTMNGNHCGDFSNSGSHQTDWRLPNIRELQSLVHFGFFDPVVPNTAGTSKYSWGDPFYFLQSSYYWSSTTFSANTLIAFQIFMQNGLTHFTNKTNSLGYVWPVRAGI